MKKLLLIGALFISGSAFAAGYGSAGCGLGSMVIGNSQGFSQVFAATTNGTSGSQTFGISSGTSNCAAGGSTASLFIEANKVALSNDVARGRGESLTALSQIYGVKDLAAMEVALKNNYKVVFKNDNAEAINMEITKILADNTLI
jgi:hypothetical protein